MPNCTRGQLSVFLFFCFQHQFHFMKFVHWLFQPNQFIHFNPFRGLFSIFSDLPPHFIWTSPLHFDVLKTEGNTHLFYKHQVNLTQPQLCLRFLLFLNNRPIVLLFLSQKSEPQYAYKRYPVFRWWGWVGHQRTDEAIDMTSNK